jgi:hypothetical protein
MVEQRNVDKKWKRFLVSVSLLEGIHKSPGAKVTVHFN